MKRGTWQNEQRGVRLITELLSGWGRAAFNLSRCFFATRRLEASNSTDMARDYSRPSVHSAYVLRRRLRDKIEWASCGISTSLTAASRHTTVAITNTMIIRGRGRCRKSEGIATCWSRRSISVFYTLFVRNVAARASRLLRSSENCGRP